MSKFVDYLLPGFMITMGLCLGVYSLIVVVNTALDAQYAAGYAAGQQAKASTENQSKVCTEWWFGQDRAGDLLARHKQAKKAYCQGGL